MIQAFLFDGSNFFFCDSELTSNLLARLLDAGVLILGFHQSEKNFPALSLREQVGIIVGRQMLLLWPGHFQIPASFGR